MDPVAGHSTADHAQVLNRRLPLLLVNRNAGRVEGRTADQVASLLRERGPVEVVVTSEADATVGSATWT